MKQKKLKLITVLLLGLGLIGLQAQEVIPASGGKAIGTGGSVSYSVGQMVYTTNTGTNNYSIAEGVQQPYEISIVAGIEQAKGINLKCLAYPNPTTDFIILKVENFNNENLIYLLFDIKGNLIERKKFTGNEIHIMMGMLVPANYFLKILSNKKVIKTFKIIKN